ncbi:MAG: nucleoside hydrolase [Myxococcales bacterium]|nr:nucleoside hydrolase [Myxococcales bacterium]
MPRLVFDMETGDPDDVLTLILLLGHPAVELRAVTVTPGTPHQVAVVREVVRRFDRDLPVGAFDLDHVKARGTPEERYVTCVSSWHWRFLGELEPRRDAAVGWQVLRDHLDADTVLVTGAPLKNLGALLRNDEDADLRFRWVAQGGFAGEGVVPAEQQLEKFRGLTTCPTYNLNGDPRSALLALADPRILHRRFVSKNVCHGVVYDGELHETVGARIEALADGAHRHSLQLVHRGMEHYLRRKPEGKAFHDPLAACCALTPEIGTWAEVELYRQKGKWGSRLAPPAERNATILIGYDRVAFLDTLLGITPPARP